MGRSRTYAMAICLLLTCAAEAQPSTKTARIAMLCPVRCIGAGYAAFEDELRRLGWVEGSNLTVERRALEGRYERVSELAAEIVRLRPDLIVGPGAPIARALKEATSDIPIAFSFVAHPVEIGLVQSLARPGHNVTGVAAITPGAFLVKQLEVLRELLPQAKRVAVLATAANDDYRLALSREVPLAAQLGLQIEVIEVRTRDEVPSAVDKAKTLGADGVLVLGDAILNTPPNRMPELLAQALLPALYSNTEAVRTGGLISYTSDVVAIARRHAHYVDHILRGASPAEMPVEQPTGYILIFNLKTAKALGLTVPSSLLSQADEVIE
ncbi:putative ABC transport system substrate-binding protein [Microvirga lupini]|uniref:Putative ABC transport system substrate-binding protein n=1 Tax=Microvirga lupini TaxID=420324 RepID=A0A7W4YZF1_9HYPH|nr:ABC transporter substrate-binding protein [Microvirga lupini]MBB3020963.1 putative ABC transport system substrate-binding protein [Microvirga lupini]